MSGSMSGSLAEDTQDFYAAPDLGGSGVEADLERTVVNRDDQEFADTMREQWDEQWNEQIEDFPRTEPEPFKPAQRRNVSDWERAGSLIAGIGMLTLGLAKRRWKGALIATIGGLLIRRAATGYCPVYNTLNKRDEHTPHNVSRIPPGSLDTPPDNLSIPPGSQSIPPGSQSIPPGSLSLQPQTLVEKAAQALRRTFLTAFHSLKHSLIRKFPAHLSGSERMGNFPSKIYPKIQNIWNTAPRQKGVPGKGRKVEARVWIHCLPERAFQAWRHLENLPQFMPDVISVRQWLDGTSHWVVRGVLGRQVEWDAEIVNEHPGEMIAWQSLEHAQVLNAGTVRFEPDGGGTLVRVVMEYRTGGSWIESVVGDIIARFFGDAPEHKVQQNLEHFKQWVETGARG